MARPKKEESIETVKTQRKKRYYSRYMSFSFSVPAVDADGKPKIERNNFGQPIYDANGNEKEIFVAVKFRNLVARVSQGYLCCYDFDPSDETPQNQKIGEVLERMAKDQTVNVTDEDTYDRQTNGAMYEEKRRRIELEDEVARLRSENEKLSSPEELTKRLDELTRG